MGIDLLSLISDFRSFDDRENANACFKTRVPWIAPEAYLNIVYRPAPAKPLSEVAERWAFPADVVDLLARQNGAMLFSGALSLYGVVEPGRLLNRRDPFSLPPFNIEGENKDWSFHPGLLLVVGGYQFDGSRVCIDRSDRRIHVFPRGKRIPSASWTDLESWLVGEVQRLRLLFDEHGKRIGPVSEMGPPSASVSV